MTTPNNANDDGFTIVESMVAAVVLVIGAAAVAALLISALDLTRGNAQRVQAAGLVTAQVESVRGMGVDVIPLGTTTSTSSQRGTTYTTTTEVAWSTTSGSGDACTDGSAATVSKRVKVTVTWPDMRRIQPVTGSTLVAATTTSPVLDTLPGAAAVQVRGADGAGVSGVDVTLSDGSTSKTAKTGSTGCAGFAGLTKGSYSASATKAGAVGRSGSAVATTGSFSVLPGRVVRPRADLDTAGSLKVTLTAPAGTTVLAQTPTTLEAPFFVPSTRRLTTSCSSPAAPGCAQVSATQLTIGSLFPGTYRVAGCSGGTGTTAVEVTRGGTATTTLALGGAKVTSSSGALPALIYARPASAGVCGAAAALDISSSTATSGIALADGSWEFSRTSSFATVRTATLVASTVTTVSL